MQQEKTNYIMRMRARVHLTPVKVFTTRKTQNNMEMELTFIDFSHRGAEGSRSSWLQTLGNQLIDRSPYIRHTNHKHYLMYNTT